MKYLILQNFRVVALAVLSCYFLGAPRAQGLSITQNFSASPGLAIPDGSATGISPTFDPGFTITDISSVIVTLDVGGAPSGGWNGDLYVHLAHSGGVSVLLNRPNRTAGNLAGAIDGGLVFTFDDAASVNAHNYTSPGTLTSQVGPLTLQPDGRTTDPLLVFDTDIPSATSSLTGAFGGLSALGTWTFLIVDNQGGIFGDMTFDSFNLGVTGDAPAVPEPGTLIPLTVLMAGITCMRKRRSRK